MEEDMTEDKNKYEELLRLSLECYLSLRRKYTARVSWTPEFEAWSNFLDQEQEGKLKEQRFYSSIWVNR
jgi:hypothetical protein